MKWDNTQEETVIGKASTCGQNEGYSLHLSSTFFIVFLIISLLSHFVMVIVFLCVCLLFFLFLSFWGSFRIKAFGLLQYMGILPRSNVAQVSECTK